MDDIVKQAVAKWPNVPYCYRWLALDARGTWRMRDERAQAQGLAGEPIRNEALLGFINRNYMPDEQSAWYFQNGPQRVYVDLEATPYIARTDPQTGFKLHTGEPLTDIERVWMTEEGRFILEAAGKIAMLDDRDAADCLALVRISERSPDDDMLMNWLTNPMDGSAALAYSNRLLTVGRISSDALERHFGFVKSAKENDPRASAE
jgi:hypothetical protein